MVIHALDDLYYDLLNYGRSLTIDEEVRIVRSITRQEIQSYIERIVEGEPALIAYGDSQNLHSRDQFMDILQSEKPNPENQRAFEVT